MWPFDQNNQQMYQQYAQVYDTGNSYGIDNNQMWEHLLQFMRGAPMDMQQRIYQQHFEQMPYEQRVVLAQQMPQGYFMDPNNTRSMAQSFHRLGQEQPGMVQHVLSHPVLTGAALGLVGLIARYALSQHQQSGYQEQYGYHQPQYGYQQDPYAQPQLYQEQQEVRELRHELRQEEQEERREERREERNEERFEEREHHHHRDEW